MLMLARVPTPSSPFREIGKREGERKKESDV
jgi:hypothetical protein